MTASTPTDRSLPAREALARAAELADAWLATLPDRPIPAGATPEMKASLLDESLPEAGIDPGDAAAEWLSRAEPGIVPINGPRYFGFVMGGTLPGALAGDVLASTIDQNGRASGNESCAPPRAS
jgi:hypothetical protein